MKRNAFQILLQKRRELRTSETDRCKSPPGRERKEGVCQVDSSGTGSPQPCQPFCVPQHILAELTQSPVGAQGESQGIRPTFGDPMRKVLSL